MSTLACPSCGAVLAKLPQRKTKCKSCGEFIFVKTTPDDCEKRLMTAKQADVAEAAWGKKYEEEEAVRAGAVYGLPSLPNNPEVRLRFYLLKIEQDMAKAARAGFRSVQITAGQARDRLCPACKALDQKVISVNAGAQTLVPAACQCLQKGMLLVSAAIKHPDGRVYFDKTEGRGP